MHNFRLLICASVFMALSAGATAENMDYTGLCLKCADKNAFPDCPTNETATHLNLTIYCQKSKEHYCTLRIVNGSDEDVFSRDLICRLPQASLDLEKLQSDEDDFKIVSIREEPVKPLPLLLQTTTETVKTTTDGGNIQILSITQEAIESLKPEASHMAIVANSDAMAALEDGTDGENTESAAAVDAAEAGENTDAEVESAADPEIPAEPVEVSAPEADAEAVPEETEPAKDEVAEDSETPAEVPENPAEVVETPADVNETPAEVPETPAEIPETPVEVPESPAEDPEAAATATEAGKDAEASINTDSIDYQGDEAKPDAEAEAVAPPVPTGEVKVPDSPIGGNEPPVMPPMKCYACTSLSYVNCTERPDTEIDCHPVEEGKNIKNGCYTLFKVDTNMTSRGCISDLAVEDIQYCKENNKLCTLCYEQSCNHLSTSLANYEARMNMSMIVGMLLAVMIASYL